MNYLNDPQIRINNYRTRVNNVVQAGGTTSRAWDLAVARWNAMTATPETTPAQDLENAYREGKTVKTLLPLKEAAILAHVTPATAHGAVKGAIAPAAYADHTMAYHDTAAANYTVIQGKFNALAQQLTTISQQVDVDGDAARLLNANEKDRAAYVNAEIIATQLDQLASVTIDAAVLCGHVISTDAHKIGLLINAKDLHVRRVYEAWASTDGRTGKWGKLLALGADIEAVDLDEYKPYTTLLPMENVQERTEYGVKQYLADPHDD